MVPQGTPPPPRPAGSSTPAIAPRAPKPGEVESDPIRCWWKADRTSVRVGEKFGLVLTCSVIETGPITVVPVLNQLEPGALSLTPFEVVSGVSHDDVVVSPWRYIQREYSVRLLSDGFFGQDVTIPALTVTYNLQERGSGSQGRDQQYILPPLPMRILSLVPKSVDDIRDASGQTFASIESRRFRASLATTTAWVSFAFASVFGIFALVRATGQLRAKKKGIVKPLPASSVLGASLAALARVKEDASQAGWTSELSRRASSALRIAGAVALNRPVVSSSLDPRWGARRTAHRVLRLAAATARVALGRDHLAHDRLGDEQRTQPGREHPRESGVDLRGSGRLECIRLWPPDERGRRRTRQRAGGDTQAVRRIRSTTLWPRRTAQALRSFVGF